MAMGRLIGAEVEKELRTLPQAEQNLASASLSFPHWGHFMI
jgi:hypothetical protein